MKTSDLLMNSLPLSRQPGFFDAIEDYMLWLQKYRSSDRAVRRFSGRNNKWNAYPFKQFLAGKMSENEVRQYCAYERLLFAVKVTENLLRDLTMRIRRKYVEFSVANAGQGSHDQFTVTEMREEISRVQVQFNRETSIALLRALKENIIEV